ncbi:hypothetical protein FPQ18DRAFT_337518 [Pyronema domesticum]|nr:hypothetical protein FPQ18DRAFT_337518 [Pyronema domesticum]
MGFNHPYICFTVVGGFCWGFFFAWVWGWGFDSYYLPACFSKSPTFLGSPGEDGDGEEEEDGPSLQAGRRGCFFTRKGKWIFKFRLFVGCEFFLLQGKEREGNFLLDDGMMIDSYIYYNLLLLTHYNLKIFVVVIFATYLFNIGIHNTM